MLEIIKQIAVDAGEIVTNLRKAGFQIHTKSSPFDFVTSADIKSEEYILKRLLEEFPNYSILSEEKGRLGNNNSLVWMVDPLDGTKDFKNGGTGFSIMIGLCRDGKPVLGVVYAPAKHLLYFSQKGQGAYLRIDGKNNKLKVSSKKQLKAALMVTRIPHGEKRKEDKFEELFDVKEKIPESSVGIKLGMIASSKADFHVNTNFRVNKWDTCAPQIILEEAGGKVSDFLGQPLDYNQSENTWSHSFVASNKFLHKKILAKLLNSENKELFND